MTDPSDVLLPNEEDLVDELIRRKALLGWRVYRNHWAGRTLSVNSMTSDHESRILYDGSWLCSECRAFNEQREGGRITTAFEEGGYDCWVTIIDPEDRRPMAEEARDAGLHYVAVPIFLGDMAFLTTGPFDTDSAKLTISQIESLVMPLRDRGRLSASRGFLPPARPFDFWEAYHPSTRRRCWHLHDTENGAGECAIETGERLDGTPTGWYTRGTSPLREVGSVSIHGDRLRELLDRLRVKNWLDQDTDSESAALVFGPLEWDDAKFVKLRAEAGWRKPSKAGDDWRPPPIAVQVTVTVEGHLVVPLERRA